jgi:hypothetical protein
MKVTYLNSRENGVKIYSLTGNAEEIKAYKKVKGDKLIEDKATGKALYFTSRPMSSDVEYTLDKEGYLIDSAEAGKSQEVLNALSQFRGMNLMDLQKFAAIKQAGF